MERVLCFVGDIHTYMWLLSLACEAKQKKAPTAVAVRRRHRQASRRGDRCGVYE